MSNKVVTREWDSRATYAGPEFHHWANVEGLIPPELFPHILKFLSSEVMHLLIQTYYYYYYKFI